MEDRDILAKSLCRLRNLKFRVEAISNFVRLHPLEPRFLGSRKVDQDDKMPSVGAEHAKLDVPSSTKCDGAIADMSRGGCCIKVKDPVEKTIGERVEVCLHVKSTVLQLTGALRWVRQQFWIGIEFSGVSGPTASQIYDLLDELELDEKALPKD
jgi:PilZ domain